MATETTMDMKLKCWGCLKSLEIERGPTWRPKGSHKLLCNGCVESRRYGNLASMVKQFDWGSCFICYDAIPDLYFTCLQRTPGTLQGHAMCRRCFDMLRKSSSTSRRIKKSCPKCRGRMVDRITAVHTTTVVVIPDDNQVRCTPKDVLDVRLQHRKLVKEVKVSWEDTWERLNSIHDWTMTEDVLELRGEYIHMKWKDSWVGFTTLEDSSLKERAEKLFQKKYGL